MKSLSFDENNPHNKNRHGFWSCFFKTYLIRLPSNYSNNDGENNDQNQTKNQFLFSCLILKGEK